MIKTSIIVPVYNTAEYLKDCFESIYNQTQKEIEVIAINDGSTDNSLNILKEIKCEHPDMIIYSQRNTGLGSARNKGMELATGEYIYFLDSDDCLKTVAMDVCYQYCKNSKLDIVMFDAEVFGMVERGNNPYDRTGIITDQEIVLSGEEFANKYWWNSFCPSACLIYSSAQFIRKYNLKFLPDIYYEDNEFYCKTIPLAERVMYIPQTLYKRRYRDGSIMTSEYNLRCAKNSLQMIQAINLQHHSIGMHAVIKNLKINFLYFLLVNCEKNDLFLDNEFFQELYEIVKDICGSDIENINTYRAIKVWDHMIDFDNANIVSVQTKIQIKNKTLEILKKTFEKVSLHLENKHVGIYGTGVYTDRFLEAYEKNIGEIEAKLVFIDSNFKTGEKKYRNYNIVNVDDIGDLQLDCIVIASVKYEQEIYKTIRKKYGDRFNIICLKTDLEF